MRLLLAIILALAGLWLCSQIKVYGAAPTQGSGAAALTAKAAIVPPPIRWRTNAIYARLPASVDPSRYTWRLQTRSGNRWVDMPVGQTIYATNKFGLYRWKGTR